MRNRTAPASRSSCSASPPVGVLLLFGGPGENPIGNIFFPLITRTLSAVTVTTEPVWARAESIKLHKNSASKKIIPTLTQARFIRGGEWSSARTRKSGAWAERPCLRVSDRITQCQASTRLLKSVDILPHFLHIISRSRTILRTMTSIKIECGCGQRYAFDVEPVNGQMPYTVACPTCGVDGTGAANEVIAQSLQSVAVAALPAGRSETVAHSFQAAAPAVRIVQPAVHVAAPAAPRTTHTRSVLLPGQTDPTQVAHEARAKIFWGDPPQEVLKFLCINNVPRQEAMEIIRE